METNILHGLLIAEVAINKMNLKNCMFEAFLVRENQKSSLGPHTPSKSPYLHMKIP